MSHSNPDDKRIIYDELNKLQIDQLHKATINISDNSLETKKLCVAVLSGVVTILAGINKDKNLSDWIQSVAILGVLISSLFYIVDSFLWYYQKKLRATMIIEENEIRERHGINKRKEDSMCRGLRWLNAFFNGSQTMYYGLILFSGISEIIL